MPESKGSQQIRSEDWVRHYRKKEPSADRWASGYGVIRHSLQTQACVFAMAEILGAKEIKGDGQPLFELLRAADRLASAVMWLVVHQTYARNVFLDGRDLASEDFKTRPEGHTGGSLNMVPAYVGYMAANAITGHTRSWVMGQGHCVAAIDSLNLLLDNMTDTHASRYSLTDEGLSRYVRDFYSYRLTPEGKQDSPLGSHVNVHTGGGMTEGGYLGFTELQYVHMPLPGEKLVVFLSDGAFEEQRGSDWASRWWRAKDTGTIAPIMINNGRRIDQRTTMSQQGGSEWLVKHLELNGFDPFVLDGQDPAAFAWAIIEMESRLEAAGRAVDKMGERYPVRLPYSIAVAPKGAGFYGEGTNNAHNLPLGTNPHTDSTAAHHFNESSRMLWVPFERLKQAIGLFQHHGHSGRPKERDHIMADRRVNLRQVPAVPIRPIPKDRNNPQNWTRASPMLAVDALFLSLVSANPHLRPRVGNPDEMRSNRLLRTMEALKFRVTDPEPDLPEAIDGAVVTALNEEAVACAALGNKGGINLIHTYEAFGTKMQGVLRQEIIFSQQAKEEGRMPGWLSVPLLLTSHTWENAKNEISHQDPALAESMLGEHSDISRVVFPPDYNTAAIVMRSVYQTHGQIWSVVASKAESAADLFTQEEAEQLLEQGAMRLDWAGYRTEEQRIILTAIGGYQLEEVLKASNRLADRDMPHSVVYIIEPGRIRLPRSSGEAEHQVPEEIRHTLYPDNVGLRLFVCHTRPEPLLGVLQPLNTGCGRTVALGFTGAGGTLTVQGMLFVNRCTWAHIVERAAGLLDMPPEKLLDSGELAALQGRGSPEGVIF
ncbi:xylulose 5-phosphate 3-epimerase [Acidobacteriota bacterium]